MSIDNDDGVENKILVEDSTSDTVKKAHRPNKNDPDEVKKFHLNTKEQEMIKLCGSKTVVKKIVYAMILVMYSTMLGLSLPKQSLAADETDPMIKITSLPIKQNLTEVMTGLSADVARDTGLDKNFVTYYWQTFDEIYCPGCEGAKIKKPIFVDLYVPGFMTDEQIQDVMNSLAASLEKHTDYTRKELFMHTHVAKLGRIFINGVVVNNWKQAGGPDSTENKDQ